MHHINYHITYVCQAPERNVTLLLSVDATLDDDTEGVVLVLVVVAC